MKQTRFPIQLPKKAVTDDLYELIEMDRLQTIVTYMVSSKFRTIVRLKSWIKDQVENPSLELLKLAKTFERSDKNYDRQIISILKWVRGNVRYVSDYKAWTEAEKWQTAQETFTKRTGDCFAGYEEIHTPSGVKRIDEIVVGDEVLSYDFKKNKYVNKRVIDFWPKGKLPVARVHLRNGQWFDVTEDHPMWARINEKGKSVYEKTKLSDIDLSIWWKRKIPISKKVPYNKVKPLFSKELYRVIGHYIAEGWTDKKSKVDSSGYELTDHIIPVLEKNNIPFTEYKNSQGVPCIRFLSSTFKEYLKLQKTDSFNIHIKEEIKRLPQEYLEEFLHGLWLGDGTKQQYPDKRGFANNKEWTYSTSSKKLADDLQQIHLYLGKPLHIWKQNKHKGLGKKPIYRLNYNSNSYFNKDYGYRGISEVSISYIEKLKPTEMYDLTVEDTHTVILKNGSILHQCEDGGCLIYVLGRLSGIPHTRMEIVAGNVHDPFTNKTAGHCWCAYKPQEFPVDYIFADWCYYYTGTTVNSRNKFVIQDNYIGEWEHVSDLFMKQVESKYYTIWFGFNEKIEWKQNRPKWLS